MLSPAPRLVLPPVDHALRVGGDSRNGHKRVRKGVVRALEVRSGDGEWLELDPDRSLWRLNIASPQATALRLNLKGVELPAGGQLFVYSAEDPEATHVYESRGPYGDGEFWTAPVTGEEIAVEAIVPRGSQARFEVSALGHEWRSATPEPAGAAGSCNLDVSCHADWRDDARSVVLITFNDANFIYQCSAALVNNLTADYSPLLLTAGHCLSTDTLARTLYADIDYRSYQCGAQFPDTSTRGSGARMLAHSSAADVSLLVLLGIVPRDLPLAGWNSESVPSGSNVIGIHHPQGDMKKISFGATTTASPQYPAHLAVKWTSGITESGSSGSPLFKADHKIVGVLSGGESSCSNPAGVDYYGGIASAYPVIQPYFEGGLPNDSFEPNESREQATVLPAQDAAHSVVLKLQDQDWYKVSLEGQKIVKFKLTSSHSTLTTASVFAGTASQPVVSGHVGFVSLRAVKTDSGTRDYFLQTFLQDGLRAEFSLEVAVTGPTPPTQVEVREPDILRFGSFRAVAFANLNGWPGTVAAEWSSDPAFASSTKMPVQDWTSEYDTSGRGIDVNASGLVPETEYYVRMTATNLAGTVVTPVKTIRTTALPPPNPIFTLPKDGAAGLSPTFVSLSWNSTDGATYDIYLGTQPDPPLAYQSGYHALHIFGLKPNTKYYWRIVNRYMGRSAAGPEFTFTTRDYLYKATPMAVDFGKIFYSNTALLKTTVRIDNAGPYNGSVSTQISGPFTIQSSTCSYVLAGESCSVVVGFQPQTQGSFAGSLFVSGFPESPYAVPLTAYVGDVKLSLVRPRRPARWATSSAAQSYEVKIGASAGMDAIAELSCSGVPAGVTCTVYPQNVGLAGGAASATVTVRAPQRSQRLRAPRPETIPLKVHATIQGVTRTLEIPVQIQR